jgi:hypothetical protein
MQFFETSAKTNYNVNETFTYLTKEILSTSDVKATTGNIVIGDKKEKGDKKDKKGCC